MSYPAITVENLSKAYRIGLREERYPTFREALAHAVRAPLRRLHSLSERGTENDTFWALKDVSFEVQPGEVVGIIGRNGAGKSTLLKILSRITEPTEGLVRLRGRVASLLEVGTGFHPELTGRENIYLNGSILGMRKAEIDRKFDEIVAFSEIEKFLDTPVKRYSSGMYVRLAFAVAAHLEPEILIVDEVLAVGDAEFQKKCLGKVRDVSQGGGRTVLFVSHNMVAIRGLCRTCCVLEGGRVAFLGDVDSATSWYTQGKPSVGTMPRRDFTPPRSGGPWMRSVALTSSSGEGRIQMGDDLALIVEFAAPALIRQPRLGLVIEDEQGQRILCSNNRYQPCIDLDQPCDHGRIICELGMIPFMPGRYSLSLWFGDIAHDSHVEDNALTFEVHERDVWGLGRIPPRSASALWWPTRFVAEIDDRQVSPPDPAE